MSHPDLYPSLMERPRRTRYLDRNGKQYFLVDFASEAD